MVRLAVLPVQEAQGLALEVAVGVSAVQGVHQGGPGAGAQEGRVRRREAASGGVAVKGC